MHNVALIIGALFLIAGTCLFSIPAGLIVTGLLVGAFALLSE